MTPTEMVTVQGLLKNLGTDIAKKEGKIHFVRALIETLRREHDEEHDQLMALLKRKLELIAEVEDKLKVEVEEKP